MQQNLAGYKLTYKLYRKKLYPGTKIQITKKGEIKVTTCLFTSIDCVNRFLLQKYSWITKNQEKIKTYFALTDERNQHLMNFTKYINFTEKEININYIALLKAAKETLPSLMENIAYTINLNYTELSFRNNRQVWGSCNLSNKINLNIRLLLLPQHLLLYVLYHELAHIKHKNHSSSFWHYLEKVYPGASVYAKEMKNFGYILQLNS